MRPIYLISTVAISILAIGGIGYVHSASRIAPVGAAATVVKTAAPSATSPGKQPQLTADDRILGNKDAPITIIEYASLTCPHCAHFDEAILPKIKQNWIDTGKAKLAYRNFPFDQAALKAAMLAYCAPPDRYFAFLDVLFKQQDVWATASDVTAALTRLGKLGGMSEKQVTSCLKNDKLADKIVAQRLSGEKEYGVNSTPTFFINGHKVVGALPYEEFDSVLKQAAAKT